MQNIYGSTQNKSLKLNINTSSVSEVSFGSTVSQELNSFNPKLSFTLKPSTTNTELLDKRANENDLESNEFEQVVKKQRTNSGNSDTQIKQDQEKNNKDVVKAEYQEGLEQEQPNVNNLRFPVNYRIPPSAKGLPQRMRVPVPNSFIQPTMGPLIPQPRMMAHPHPQRNMLRKPMNPQAVNFRRVHPCMRPIHPTFNKNMNGMMARPRLPALNAAHQMVQMELARLGANSQNVKAFYQDLQMLQALRDECQVLRQVKGKIMTNQTNQYAEEPAVKPAMIAQTVEKPSQRKLSADADSETLKASGSVTLGSSFFSFQGAKIIQQEAQNLINQQEKAKNSPSPSNATSTIKINFSSNNLEISKDAQEENQTCLEALEENVVSQENNEELTHFQQSIDLGMNDIIENSIQEKIEEITA